MEWILKNQFLYHVTSSEAAKEILNVGLTPRKIAGYFGEGGKFICLTTAKHINSYFDNQREIILQIPISSLSLDSFCPDVTHALYNALVGTYKDDEIIQYMLNEYGTIGYFQPIPCSEIKIVPIEEVE